jgi:hypothetical protein
VTWTTPNLRSGASDTMTDGVRRASAAAATMR